MPPPGSKGKLPYQHFACIFSGLELNPFRISTVEILGLKTASRISQKWREFLSLNVLMSRWPISKVA